MWERPSFCLAGAFFYVGASYARSGELRACLAPGVLIFGVDVRAVVLMGWRRAACVLSRLARTVRDR